MHQARLEHRSARAAAPVTLRVSCQRAEQRCAEKTRDPATIKNASCIDECAHAYLGDGAMENTFESISLALSSSVSSITAEGNLHTTGIDGPPSDLSCSRTSTAK